LEHKLSTWPYLNDEEMYDYEIHNEIGLSERRYYRQKARIFYKVVDLSRSFYSLFDSFIDIEKALRQNELINNLARELSKPVDPHLSEIEM
jgi:hypothetical protein